MKEYIRKKKNIYTKILILGIVLIINFFISIGLGRISISASDVFKAFLGQNVDDTILQVIFKIRVPRIVIAILCWKFTFGIRSILSRSV